MKRGKRELNCAENGIDNVLLRSRKRAFMENWVNFDAIREYLKRISAKFYLFLFQVKLREQKVPWSVILKELKENFSFSTFYEEIRVELREF